MTAPQSWASSPAVREVMRSNRGRDTRPELALRRALHANGLRYRVNTRPIPGSRMNVDVVFSRRRVAVEMRGCFWHGCDQHYRPATRNARFWSEKIAATIQRDNAKQAALEAAGWVLVVVWEHDDIPEALERITALVAARNPGDQQPPTAGGVS